MGESQNTSIEEEVVKEKDSAVGETVGRKLTDLKEFYTLAGGEQNSMIKTEELSDKKPKEKKKESETQDSSVSPCKEAVSPSSGGAALSNSTPSPCLEVAPESPEEQGTRGQDDVDGDPFDWVGYSQANAALTVYCNRLPPPTQFGAGNPFLMFLCLSCLLQHRDLIMRDQLDYQDIAMYFDRLVRAHDVDRVLSHARRLFAEYLNEDWSPSPQPTQLPNC